MFDSQLSLRALLLGLLLSAILASANAYLGLTAGLTVSASIPAAVISMAILRLLGNSQLLENNMVQTAASAGESLAAGAIFTLPALLMIGYWQTPDFAWTLALCGLGGVLGVLFTIPLRQALIDLPYPEGTATAEVLKVGHSQNKNAAVAMQALLWGAAFGAVIKFCISALKIWPAITETATKLGQSVWYAGSSVSPALLGVGYIVGLNISLLVFAGGVIAWWVAIPIYSHFFAASDPSLLPFANDPLALSWQIWTSKIRYLGVGAMLVGGLWTLWSIRQRIYQAVQTASQLLQQKNNSDDLPNKVLIPLLLGCCIPLYVLYSYVLNSYVSAVPLTIIMLIAAFLFSAVAAWLAGVVGSSHNPVSGMTIATILLAALLLLLLGGAESQAGPAGAIMVGAVVCCAAAIGGDNMQDLKAGHILGASPAKQQIAQLLGVAAAAVVIGPVLHVLHVAYGFGPPSEAFPDSLAAPQATLMASVADGVFHGNLPWGMVGCGAILGTFIILLDQWLKKLSSDWQAPVLAVAVGIYLPLEMAVPIACGGVLAYAIRGNIHSTMGTADNGVLVAAGFITGEALMGIALAIPIALGGSLGMFDISAIFKAPALGLVAFIICAALLYKKARAT